MKLFGRTSGYYLFWTGFIYFWVGFYLALEYSGIAHYATMAWLFALSIPLWCPPVARYFNMDHPMFNWFGKKSSDETPNNVVKFPELKEVPQVEPPKKEEPAKIYYRLGLTDNNRVAFSMGYSEITMNAQGVQNMIDQLEFFKTQIQDEELE